MENPSKGGVEGLVLFYPTGRNEESIEVRMESETVWLTQQQMAALYQTVRGNFIQHLQEIFGEGELQESETSREIQQQRLEGGRTVNRKIKLYNLVSGYFDFAELRAMQHEHVYMQDYVQQLEDHAPAARGAVRRSTA